MSVAELARPLPDALECLDPGVRSFIADLVMDGRFIHLCRTDPRAAAAKLGVELDEEQIEAIRSQDWSTLLAQTVDQMRSNAYRTAVSPELEGEHAVIWFIVPVAVAIIIDRSAGAVPDSVWVSDIPPEDDDRL